MIAFRAGGINYGQPVNWSHPLNRGLVWWWMVLPDRPPTWVSATSLIDLCQRDNGYLGDMARGLNPDSVPRVGGWGSLAFDGVNDNAQVAGLSAFSGAATTVAAWLRCSAYDASGFVWFGTTVGATTYWQVASNTACYCSTTLVNVTSTPFADGAWRHLCFVATAAATEVYVNGISIGTGAAPTSVAAGSKTFMIGDWYGAPTTDFNLAGNMDDLRVYNRSLVASDVRQLYNLSRQRYPGVLNRVGTTRWIADVQAAAAGRVPQRMLLGVGA